MPGNIPILLMLGNLDADLGEASSAFRANGRLLLRLIIELLMLGKLFRIWRINWEAVGR